MSVDLSGPNNAPPEAGAPQAKPSWAAQLRTGFRELQIIPPLLYGLASGLLMTFALLDPSSVFALLAGIIPVSAGLLLVRSIRGHYALHGFVTGVIAALVSLVALAIVIFLTPLGPELAAKGAGGPLLQEWVVRGMLPAFMLLIFCTFGASTSGRMEERNKALRAEVTARGGQLEKPGVIRTADDIRGLSLPQLGSYVNNLFKKKGFTFKDYRFLDKDKHLDLWMEKDGEPWHLRISVADKISPGTIESLLQEMKRDNSRRGVVITSTEFTPAALKSAKDRPVVLIDGPTLYEIAE
ncbi:MAG: restriction endonuclease [Roseiflexaceae bacterium]|nr:restriction endonuclease [Roseiflexaceae bacterium]